MKMELSTDGFERIEADIREIEYTALDGACYYKGTENRFYQIQMGIKKLRQTLLEVLLIDPEEPEAA
jgi:hypothetical protein